MMTTHRQLLWLTLNRGWFRLLRAVDRMRSPRRIISTMLAVFFFIAYVLNGVVILASRSSADLDSLRLWLSGGMVLYLIYHAIRCVWTEKQLDLEYSDAENLWLGGAPIRRASFAAYKISTIAFSAALKTFFLVIALAPDVERLGLLATGVFTALVLLEIVRVIWQRFISGLSPRHRMISRIALTAIAAAVVIQLFAQLARITPPESQPGVYVFNSFRAVGEVASCDAIQWLATPWRPAALLATTSVITPHTAVQLFASLCLIPAALLVLVRVDRWADRSTLAREKARLAGGDFRSSVNTQDAVRSEWVDSIATRLDTLCPPGLADTAALLWRQSLSIRRYFGTIVFSFVVPTALCLSPLLTGTVGNQWAFIVGGIALCTMLLAPPALRLDFRRDLKRMLLLRSLPVRPLQTVLGQLTLPVLITITFQVTTLTIAALIISPGWSQLTAWLGMLSALAVFTFATENALFLAYPHHERAQGLGMVVRANVMFLGKATLIALAIIALMIWVTVCRSVFGETLGTPIYVTGAIVATWTLAAAALLVTAWCWQRFDIADDLPPE
jgi:hypothetical protein